MRIALGFQRIEIAAKFIPGFGVDAAQAQTRRTQRDLVGQAAIGCPGGRGNARGKQVAMARGIVQVQRCAQLVVAAVLVAVGIGIDRTGDQRTFAHFGGDGRGTERGTRGNHRADRDARQVVEQQQSALEVGFADHPPGRQRFAQGLFH